MAEGNNNLRRSTRINPKINRVEPPSITKNQPGNCKIFYVISTQILICT